ncbi:MAG: hypothetical protein ACRDFX_02055 [Chloroflexota bacterium]
MKHSVLLLVTAALFSMYEVASAAGSYSPRMSGSVQGYRLSGVEPDGDPLYQVALRTRLSASGSLPALNVIISSYLENFKPDTTPILPDLLHPAQTAHNLGGFLQGKALLTDDAGNVLYIGNFLAEAFLNNTNHAIITLFGSNTAAGGGRIKGLFSLNRNRSGGLTGSFQGRLKLSASALSDVARNRGKKMKPIKKIISVVSVVPHYYGTAGKKSSGPPLHTGFATPKVAVSGSRVSDWTIAAGAGAILALIIAGILFFMEKRQQRNSASAGKRAS